MRTYDDISIVVLLLGSKVKGRKAYSGGDIGRADVTDVLKSALGPTRHGLLPYHPHGVVVEASLPCFDVTLGNVSE